MVNKGSEYTVILTVVLIISIAFYGIYQLYINKQDETTTIIDIPIRSDYVAQTPTPTVGIVPLATEQKIDLFFVENPSTTKANEEFIIKWKIDAAIPSTTIHTAIYYGYNSIPADLPTQVTPNNLGFLGFSRDYVVGNFEIPNTFTSGITVETLGPLYVRIYAIINEKNYWSAEKKIEII